MADFLTETFTGTDGTLLSAHTSDSGHTWTQTNWYQGAVNVSTGEIRSNTFRASSATQPAAQNGEASYISNATPPSANYAVAADFIIGSTTVNDFVGVAARASTSGGNLVGYLTIFNATQIALWKFLPTPTQLGSAVTVSLATSTTYRVAVEVNGTTVRGWVRRASDGFYLTSAGTFQSGVAYFSTVTDTSITAAGSAAIGTRGTSAGIGASIDNLTAGDPPAVTITPTPTVVPNGHSGNITISLAGSGTSCGPGGTTGWCRPARGRSMARTPASGPRPRRRAGPDGGSPCPRTSQPASR